ncbi:hypothetical protein PR048_013740 [Dryococelus australis]|uniref:Uncharacterized protein n=1 Tax=Dryococelus australis TaxID=614101 RepID=A0ABQ9HT20_9NEOP|nr:hypothetical protein PR048_013740 [Dryococelus australis]
MAHTERGGVNIKSTANGRRGRENWKIQHESPSGLKINGLAGERQGTNSVHYCVPLTRVASGLRYLSVLVDRYDSNALTHLRHSPFGPRRGTGDPREYPPTNVIVRYDSHSRKPVGIVLAETAGQWVFSGISYYPCPCNPTLLHSLLISPLLDSQELDVKSSWSQSNSADTSGL